MPSERVSRERREAVATAICDAYPDDHSATSYAQLKEISQAAELVRMYDVMADAAIAAILPEQTAFFDAVDELVDVIKGFESDSTIEDKKIALRDLVYGDDDASGGTR